MVNLDFDREIEKAITFLVFAINECGRESYTFIKA